MDEPFVKGAHRTLTRRQSLPNPEAPSSGDTLFGHQSVPVAYRESPSPRSRHIASPGSEERTWS